MITITDNDIQRFLQFVEVHGVNECWPWTGDKYAKGYGRFRLNGKMRLAHRISHLIFHGVLDDMFMVLHSCDNPPCCNPYHLRQGTHLDNTRDAMLRNRLKSKDKTPMFGNPDPVARLLRTFMYAPEHLKR